MRSLSSLSVVQNKAKRSQFEAALARVLLVGMFAGLVAAPGPAQAVQIDNTEIELVVDPNSESMTARVRLHVTDNIGGQKLVCIFLQPTRMDYCRQCFESVHGASLADFFQRWYNEPGLPENGAAGSWA